MNYVSVVVTFNRKRLLIEAVQSLLKQSVAPKRVIVIDNCSTDGTPELFNASFDSNDPRIKYVRLSENVGGSAGFYRGIEEAKLEKVDWVSLSDDDAIFANDYFEKLAEVSQRQPKYRVLTGTVRLASGLIDSPHRERLTNRATLSVKPVPDDEYEQNFECDIFSFCGVVMQQSLINQIGMPEKDYFIRFDDFEYALRARRYGSFLNVSQALITHKTTDEGHAISPWKEYYVTRNRVSMTQKHSTNHFIGHLYLYYVMLRKLTAMLVVKDRRRERRYLSRAYFAGYHDGYQGHLGRNDHFLPGKKY